MISYKKSRKSFWFKDSIKKFKRGLSVSYTHLDVYKRQAVFLPGVAEQLAYMLDSDFYMVFTSVHEVMIHNDKFVEPEDLQCVLRDTIREATPKEDYLTSRIYQYNRETHKFICVTPLEKDEK